MNIILSYDSSASSAPAAFFTAMNTAVQTLDHMFSVNITITIDVGWGEVTDSSGHQHRLTGGAIGEAFYGAAATLTYAQARSMWFSSHSSPDMVTASQNLPSSSDPTDGAGISVSVAQMLAWGGTAGGFAGSVGFSSTFGWDFNRNDGITAGQTDFIGVALHELSHALGRISLAGVPGAASWLDMFRFSSPGVRSFDDPQAATYFSINGGTTNSNGFDNTGSDPADWGNGASNDANNAFSSSGVLNAFTSTDIREMDILGFRRSCQQSDYNGDFNSDILWRNNTNGQVLIWQMTNGQLSAVADEPSVANSWSVLGQGDFNSDATSDVVWRDSSNGQLTIWEMSNGQISTPVNPGSITTDWTTQAIGDFNHDGTSDILWRNSSDGTVLIWEMQNGQLSTSVNNGIVSSDWSIQGVGDFNTDGTSDILWRNSGTGVPAIWMMNNGQFSSATFMNGVPSDWIIKGVGDFNGDGTSDILWQNSNSQPAIWQMSASGQMASATFLQGVGTDWTIKGVGDYNGDGTSDILWQNSSSQTAVWQMQNNQLSAVASGQGVPSGWQIQ